MIVIDEYLAVAVVLGDLPAGLPDDELVLTASRHWRLLQRIHAPSGGQLSQMLSKLSPGGIDALRYPHPEVLSILDPRPLLDNAASIAANYGGGLLIAETLAAGLKNGRSLWFGTERNVGAVLAAAANDLDIALQVVN